MTTVTRDSEDSEWEDADNRAIRSMVEHYNFDLVDGMTPMEYVPIPRKSRRKWPKEDLIYTPQLREPDIEYCDSVFCTELYSPRLETAVPPSVSVDVEAPSCRDSKRDCGPWKRAGKDMDITSIILANLNGHNNLGCGDRPVTEAAPELMTKPDETLVMGISPTVINHPELRENVWCETDKRDIPVRREEITFCVPVAKILVRQADRVGGPDLSREGPFDVYDVPPEPGQSPLVLNSMPVCQYRMTSYDDRDSRVDLDPAYGIHLHDPRMMEYMGAPESARLLGRSPEYWLQQMGRERTVAAAFRLHHDASLVITNVMAQFVTSLNRTPSEVMRVVYEKEPFPTDAIQYVTPVRRVRREAHYVAAMGLWRPTSGPVFPGPIPVSSCNSCMSCEDCFPDVPV